MRHAGDLVGGAGVALAVAGAWGLWGWAWAALGLGATLAGLYFWIELRPRRTKEE